MSSKDFPFSVEYAKSNRSSCRGCRDLIAKDTLRLGIMVQSPHFDGQVPMWFHENCFWLQGKSAQLKSETDIYHFDLLRWDDQEKLRDRIQKGGRGRASMSAVSAPPKANISDFQIECAKASTAKCRECGNKILKDEVRAGRQPRGVKTVMWYHLSCFAAKKQEFGFAFDPQKIIGYDQLSDSDQNLVREKLKLLKRAQGNENGDDDGPSTSKRAKMGSNGGQSAEDELKMALKRQSDDLWNLRDNLTKNLTKKQMVELLEHNNQGIPSGEAKILDRLTDCMLFGALEPCSECSQGQLVYSSSNNSYVCTGHVSGFTSCQVSTVAPERREFLIPEGFEKNKFLSKFIFKAGRKRVFPSVSRQSLSISGSPLNRSVSSGTTSAPSKPLLNLKFAFLSNVENSTKEKIRESGGVVVSKIDKHVVAVIAPSSAGHFVGEKAEGKEVAAAKKADVHVVSEEFVEEMRTTGVKAAIEKYRLCDWGSQVSMRIANCRALEKPSKSAYSRFEERYTKSVPSTQKLVIKGGAAVDPDFEYADVAHVYQDKQKNMFNAILGRADVQMGANSYYKLQLLEHDNAKKYWLYRSWGRTGTTIGGTKVDDFGSSLEDAEDEFMRLYSEKTGNEWEERQNFEKKPYLYYPMDIDYGQEEPVSKVKAGSQSKLPQPVQDLIKMIFDIEEMKQTMKAFEIDLTKMPLGKLSKKQIQEAYSVLTELQEVLQGQHNQSKILDCTNRFFTLIPHDFGLQKIPLLDNTEIVKAKTEMLDNLLEIEVAYAILKGDTGDRDPVDAHYEKLRTDLQVLEKTSTEFKMIQDYVRNTHAATHATYQLDIEEVFVTNRHGERERYGQFKDLHNRTLLWHGSRTSNFAGILSQGLRIAPPEAPVSGYMFGKGLYFADMVSKSANYCFPNPANPVGLLLLCEVALGNVKELKHAQNVTKLPKGIHSVKGIGTTAPDPAGTTTLPDGTVVPMGKGVAADVGGSSLLYNEYIVYNVAQVNLKYMIKLRFNYK